MHTANVNGNVSAVFGNSPGEGDGHISERVLNAGDNVRTAVVNAPGDDDGHGSVRAVEAIESVDAGASIPLAFPVHARSYAS